LAQSRTNSGGVFGIVAGRPIPSFIRNQLVKVENSFNQPDEKDFLMRSRSSRDYTG